MNDNKRRINPYQQMLEEKKFFILSELKDLQSLELHLENCLAELEKMNDALILRLLREQRIKYSKDVEDQYMDVLCSNEKLHTFLDQTQRTYYQARKRETIAKLHDLNREIQGLDQSN